MAKLTLAVCCEDVCCCNQSASPNLVRRLPQVSAGVRISRRLRTALPVVAMLVAVSLWGPSFVATKVALREIPPFTIAFLRFLVASCFLYPLWWFSSERIVLSTNSRHHLLLGGLIGVASYFILENLGVLLTTAGDAALLMAAIPVICLLVETVWFRQAIPWHRGLGIVMSFSVCSW